MPPSESPLLGMFRDCFTAVLLIAAFRARPAMLAWMHYDSMYTAPNGLFGRCHGRCKQSWTDSTDVCGAMNRASCMQVGWIARAETTSWSEGVGRRFHRSAKNRPKLTLAFQQVQRLASVECVPFTVVPRSRATNSPRHQAHGLQLITERSMNLVEEAYALTVGGPAAKLSSVACESARQWLKSISDLNHGVLPPDGPGSSATAPFWVTGTLMHPAANVPADHHVQVWEFLRPSGRRQAPPLWWTAPPPQSAADVSAQTALAVSRRAAPVSGMSAPTVKKADQRRAKPAKPSATAGAPVMATADPSKVPAPRRSCAGVLGSGAMSVAGLANWLVGPAPEEAEEGRASDQAAVPQPKRKPKPVEVRSAQSRD